MGFPKEQPAVDKVVDPSPHRAGQTTPSRDDDDATTAPRLPHERDESADSQNSQPRKVMQQAHEDLENGLVDTDRGPMVDALYEDKVRTDETPARGAPDAAKP